MSSQDKHKWEREMVNWNDPNEVSTRDPVVSVDWLAKRLDAPDVRVIDASSFMPGSERDARAEYEAGHIQGAVFFDINEICDTDTDLPHMMPSAEKFASRVKRLGLGDGLRLVVYDSLCIFSAARVWWMFRHMGHEDVVVLDGGLPAWTNAGHALEDMPPIKRERHFTVRRRGDLIRDMDQVRDKLASGSAQILDARSAGRFAGTAPEPRAGLPSGHMRGAFNVAFQNVLNSDGTLKDVASLTEVMRAGGVDLSRRIVTTCGSGVTACVLALALARLGRWDVPVYDGSWSQWARTSGNEIVTGT
jgi:thiosulfate/3-mercaptopyruvate sulfurtransferase